MSKARLQQNQIGQGMILALIKEEYWNTLLSFCADYYQKTNDPLYIFWKAFAQYNLGNVNGAINELLPIKQKKQIAYACIVALLFYQNQARNVDREQIDSLRAKERDQRRNGSDRAISIAVYFFTFIKEFKKAQDLLEQKKSSSNLFIMADIWYSMWNTEEEDRANVQAKIDKAYEEKDKVTPKISIFLAKCFIKNSQKKFQEALQVLNEGIVYYPTFIPFNTQKFVSFMALGQWEQFQQAALEVSQRDTSNILAIKALAFYEIVRQGNADNAYLRIKQLENVIQKRQGKNPKLLFENCHLFLRVCGRNQRIVLLLQKIIEKCRKYDPLNADYVIEQGSQLLMLNQVSQAYKCFEQASSLDQSKLQSITGMIECKLLQDQIDDAQNQIEFVNVMQQTVGRTPRIAYLEALLTIKKPNLTNQSMNDFYKILDGALKLQIAYSKTLDSGFSYYSKLNPDFLFSIAELYLRPVSMKQMIDGNQNSNPAGPIGKGIKLLESINRQIPGFLPAYLLLAKGKLAVGNDLDSSLAITKVLQIDSRNQEGSILNAMIKNKKKDYDAAMNSLQEAISINFKIRQNPLFMLIKGEIEYAMEQYVTAEETMIQAISLPAVKRKSVEDPTAKKFKILSFSQKDRCSIFLLLAKCYTKNKKHKQSKQVMTQAIGQFAGTSEQVHVMLANAEIAVESGDIKKAMSILKQVKTDSPYFVQSRKVLADIHLKYLKSRKGYARCYYEIIETNPTFENFKIYGDALIKINQPEEASVAYEKAYQQKSDNELIIRDLGRSYALAHDYQKATKFYEDNIEKLNRPDLILDLAKLCVQLKRFERAQSLLNNSVFNEENSTYQKLKQAVEAHFLLYQVHLKKRGKYNFDPNEEARKQIKTATQYQKLVIEKLRSQGGSGDEQKRFYADLYYEIANYSNTYEKNAQTAIMMLNQCLKINEEHEKALELLSTLYLRQGDLHKCEQSCNILLKVNSKNDQAGSILAQILLKENQYSKAIQQFKKMLENEPDKYPVLAKLIDFFRRNNQLSEAKTYIEAAQNKASNSNDAGLCFCRGLYHKYSRNPTEALIEFNKAKKAHQYSEMSLYHMIDIFLCPEQDLYYSAIEGRPKAVHPENLRICESLLREMSSKASQDRFAVMDAYVTIMKGNPKQLDSVHGRLVEVLSLRSEYPPALLAMAMVKFMMGKDTEGNNFLKVCAKMTYQPEFGQELEKAWLLSAQSYIKIQKFDNAEEVLRMLLRENKSCGKAEEYMGLIREKQQAYADASDFYEKAFNLTSRKSASIGYRLAYNYFKARRFVECLEVCRQVLQVNPSYTSIRTDIQQKAIMAIR